MREYLHWLAKELSYKNHEDFYNITRQDFKNHRGSGLLSLNDNSPSKVLLKAFPDYDWKPWLFNKTPQGYWDTVANRIAYLKWFEHKIGITNPEDWYAVTKDEFANNNGGGLLAMTYQGSPAKAAQELYPKMDWNISEFGIKKKRQHRLYQIIQDIFKNQEVLWEHKFENITFEKSGVKITVDIFIPAYNLAFEYQGEQHSKAFEHWGGEASLLDIKKNDQEKREKLEERGITLIEIDHLWDGQKESVEARLFWLLDSLFRDDIDSESVDALNNKNVQKSSEIRKLSASWEMRFAQLVEFKETYGHCEVTEIEPHSQLAKWLRTQWSAKTQERLTPKRINLLETIGVIWQDSKERLTWNEQFIRLQRYKEKTGHCDISQYCKEPAGLRRWVLKQRSFYNKKQLDESKIERLESIGFCWDPLKQQWGEKIEELRAFKAQYGHCNVPMRWKDNPKLSNWVFNLRRAKTQGKSGILTSERVEELESLGFIWDPAEESWLKFFEEFKVFKKENGHGRVRKGSPLGNWLDRQRQAFKKGTLSSDKKQLLDAVSSDWL